MDNHSREHMIKISENTRITPENVKTFAAIGGQANAKKARVKKTLRETMRALMEFNYPFQSPRTGRPAQGTGYELWCAQVINGVLNSDKKCMEFMRDILGENPAAKILGSDEQNAEIRINFVDASKNAAKNSEKGDPRIVGEGSPDIDTND